MPRAMPHLLGGTTLMQAARFRASRALVGGIAIAAACLTRPSAEAPPARGREGLYSFSERMARTGEPIAGKAVVRADTVTVDLSPRPCRYDPETSVDAIVYLCAGFALWFDRRDPVGKSFYRARRTLMEPHAECTRLDVRPNGDRVCLVYEDRPVERTVDLTGPLHLVPLRLADSGAVTSRAR